MSNYIDLGSLRLQESYFLDKNSSIKPFSTELRSKESPYHFCFTYLHSVPSIKEALLNMIQSATNKIFIASFLIGDRDLLDALYSAADRLKGGVYVISALDEKSLQRGLSEMEDADSEDIKTQRKSFEGMTQRGIYVRGHSECHAKFAVVDDHMALVSSANLVGNAFTITGECGVVITQKNEVDRLARFFSRLWFAGCTWEMAPGVAYIPQRRQTSKCPFTVPMPEERVIWTDGTENFILRTIHSIIDIAQDDLIIASFSLNGIQSAPNLFLHPLQKAKERNKSLRIRLLIRARNNIKKHRADAKKLSEMGIEIFGDSRNHAKGIIADRKYGAIFSANLDTDHGLTSGVEMGVRLDGLPSLQDAINYFEHSMQYSDMQFVAAPSQREMNSVSHPKWYGHWPLNDKVAISCSEADWDILRMGSHNSSVLFNTEEDHSVMHLFFEKTRWELNVIDKSRLSLLAKHDMSETASDNLDRWLSDRANAVKRGFCPALINKE